VELYETRLVVEYVKWFYGLFMTMNTWFKVFEGLLLFFLHLIKYVIYKM